MTVTTYMQTLIVKAVTTGIGGMGRMDNTLCHKGEALRSLEG